VPACLAVILRREAPACVAVILRREAPACLAVILRREAPKGSLSIQGFSCRGAKAILSLASLAQDDPRGPRSAVRMIRGD